MRNVTKDSAKEGQMQNILKGRSVRAVGVLFYFILLWTTKFLARYYNLAESALAKCEEVCGRTSFHHSPSTCAKESTRVVLVGCDPT